MRALAAPHEATELPRALLEREKNTVLFVLRAILAAIGLAIIESNFMKAVDIAGVRPDLAVLAVVVVTSRTDFAKSILLAFALGLARDFFSGGIVGMNAFSLTLMTYFLVAIEDYLMIENKSAQIFFAFVGSTFFGVLFAFLKEVLRYETGSTSQVLGLILWTSVYTSLLAPAAFALTEKPAYLPYMRLRLKHYVEHETIPEIKT